MIFSVFFVGRLRLPAMWFPQRCRGADGQSRVILLDTHAVLWLTTDPAKLSSKAKSAIEDARSGGDGLAISDITLLELATLASKGRIQLGISLESFLHEVDTRFVVLPMSSPSCACAMGLPKAYPKDLADRIIGATALVERLSLITANRDIHRSKVVDAVW
jgi:PIN domain nuclease of toxin-antitoxin system